MPQPSQSVSISGSYPVSIDVTILATESLSDVADCDSMTVAAIIMPPAWDAADLTFQTSADNINFYDFYTTSGTEITYNVDANRMVFVPFDTWTGIQYIKVRSGTSALPVPQTLNSVITLVVKGI